MNTSDPKLNSIVIRGIASLYSVQLLSIPLGVITNLLLGRFLDPSDYGGFATANFLVGFAHLISSAGLGAALIRNELPLGEKEYSAAFSFQFFAAGLFMILFLGGAGVLGGFFANHGGQDSENLTAMIRSLCILPLLINFSTVPIVKLEQGLKYSMVARCSITAELMERVVLIGFILGGAKGFSYVYARLFGAALQALLYSMAAHWNPVSCLVEVFRNGWRGKALLKFGTLVQMKQLSGTLITGIIPGIGGKLFDAERVGLMAWAHNLAFMVGQPLPQISGRVLFSATQRLKKDPLQLRGFYESTLFMCTAFAATALLLSASVFSEALSYLFRPRWHEASVYFFLSSILMLQGILMVFYDVLLDALGHPEKTLISNWAWGAAGVVLCSVGGYFFGPRGMMSAFILSNFVPLLILSRFANAQCKIRLIKNFFVPLVLALIVSAVAYFSKPYLVHGLISLLVFSGVLFLAGVGLQLWVNPEMVRAAKKIFKKEPVQQVT